MLADRIAALTTTADLLAWDAGEQVVERTAALDVLAALPRRDVETLTLVTWHGLDIAAAAAVVGCSPRAFTVRLHRARRRLASALQDAEHGPDRSASRPGPGGPVTGMAFRTPSPSTPRR